MLHINFRNSGMVITTIMAFSLLTNAASQSGLTASIVTQNTGNSQVDDTVKATNWNTDMVADSLDNNSFDGISLGWTGMAGFYTTASDSAGALCDSLGFVTVPKTGHVYWIPISEKNAFMVERNDDPVDLSFAEARLTKQVNLLVFADAEDDSITLSAKPVYEDESEGDETLAKIAHWEYTENDSTADISDLGVVEYDYYDGISISENKNHRIYELALPVDETRRVKAIRLAATGGGWGDAAYVIGVNAHSLETKPEKHLSASLAETLLKTKQGDTVSVVVNYELTDTAGLADTLSYSVKTSSEAIALGDIVHDAVQRRITIPVIGMASSVDTVSVHLAYGEQAIDLKAQLLVKSRITADTTNCISISNWEADVIAEAYPVASCISGGIDSDGWVFYTDDILPTGALAGDERLIIAESGNVYHLAPYNENNATVIYGLGGYDLSRTIKLATPLFTDKVNLLVVSANGSSTAEVTIIYENDTKEEVQTFNVDDWYAEEAAGTEAVYGLGRIISQSNYYDDDAEGNDEFGECKYRLFDISVEAQRWSKVKALKINNNSNETYLTVLGVNAMEGHQETDIRTSGHENHCQEEYFTILGQRTQRPKNGIYIVKRADGTSVKRSVK